MSGNDDQELVGAVVRVTKDYNLERVSALMAGVTASDLSRWQRGDWKWLSRAKRAALAEFFGQHGGEEGARDYIRARMVSTVEGLTEVEAAEIRRLAAQILAILDRSSGEATAADAASGLDAAEQERLQKKGKEIQADQQHVEELRSRQAKNHPEAADVSGL